MLRVLPESGPLAGDRDKCGPVRRQLDGSLSAVPGNEGGFQFLLEELKAGKTTLEIYGFDKLIKKLEEL